MKMAVRLTDGEVGEGGQIVMDCPQVSWALTYDAFDHFTHLEDETDPGTGALKYFSVTLEEIELRLLSITTPLPEYGIKPLAAQHVLNENPENDEE